MRKTGNCIAIGPIALQHGPCNFKFEFLPQLALEPNDVVVDGREVQHLSFISEGLDGL